MTRTLPLALTTVLLGSLLTACGDTAKVDTEERAKLHEQVQATVADIKKTDPSIQRFFDNAQGYAVFPEIVTAGVGVGGAAGDGEVFEKGKFVGYTDLSQGSVGLQLGAQKYAEIIFFENESSLVNFKSGTTEFDTRASAVAAKAGAAAAADYANGVAIFTLPIGGLMAQATVGGQKFRFEPATTPTR
jgi:lipid-binding SYLF domain-containing protein